MGRREPAANNNTWRLLACWITRGLSEQCNAMLPNGMIMSMLPNAGNNCWAITAGIVSAPTQVHTELIVIASAAFQAATKIPVKHAAAELVGPAKY